MASSRGGRISSCRYWVGIVNGLFKGGRISSYRYWVGRDSQWPLQGRHVAFDCPYLPTCTCQYPVSLPSLPRQGKHVKPLQGRVMWGYSKAPSREGHVGILKAGLFSGAQRGRYLCALARKQDST